MITPIFLKKLLTIVNKSQIISDNLALEKYGTDETHSLIPHLPEACVLPTSTAQVSKIMKLCQEHEVYLTPRGAGTGKSGGCVALKGGLIIDFTLMNRIIKIDSNNLIAIAEPGVILADLKKAVEALGLFYPPDPASLEWCTLGGNIAENASGPNSVKYGSTKDYVLGLTAVLPSGAIVKLGKNTHKGVTGYDLTSLVCGSEGTLALTTEVTLKLLPKLKAEQTGLFIFASEDQAAECVSAILQNGLLPKCLEYIDEMCISALYKLNKKTPFPENAKAALLIEFDAHSQDEALNLLKQAAKTANKHGIIKTILASNEQQREKLWNNRRQLSESIKQLAKYKISEDVVVPKTNIPLLVSKLRELGLKYDLTTCAFGHAGDGSLHTQILFDNWTDRHKVDFLLKELFQITIDLGGTLTGEHGIGIAKQAFLNLEQSSEVISLQQQIKDVFDPKGLLNPGKFLPASTVKK